eukprot:TRINITY_DN102726_c0_g1_i1.p1 TRINITY_DN102726_c0_g1~~TRINITY_DN102726_c0_g1_i1.p1  ORF type:complete len:274 (-),score=35.51 TRINITY_DN102726_c0_g1_i1:6-827(-)
MSLLKQLIAAGLLLLAKPSAGVRIGGESDVDVDAGSGVEQLGLKRYVAEGAESLVANESHHVHKAIPVGSHILLPLIDRWLEHTVAGQKLNEMDIPEDELPFPRNYLYLSNCEDCALILYYQKIGKTDLAKRGLNICLSFIPEKEEDAWTKMPETVDAAYCRQLYQKATDPSPAKWCDISKPERVSAINAVGRHRHEHTVEFGSGRKCKYHSDCDVESVKREAAVKGSVRAKALMALAGRQKAQKTDFYACMEQTCKPVCRDTYGVRKKFARK